MDPEIIIPKDRKTSRSLMLSVLLGLTILLYAVMWMPLKPDDGGTGVAQGEAGAGE